MAQDDIPIENNETTPITPHPIADETYSPVSPTSGEPETIWSTTPSHPPSNRNRQGVVIITLILVLLLLSGGWIVSANLGLISHTHPNLSTTSHHKGSTPTTDVTVTTADSTPTTVNMTPTMVNSTVTTVAPGLNCQAGDITLDGSTALYPLANVVAHSYQSACPGSTINAKQSGSGTGLVEASTGIVDIGNSDIFADPAKYPGLTDHQVAAMNFSVVLNGLVTGITNLTSQQLIDIYTGQTTNWDQVGGPDLGIVTVSRTPGSGPRATFDTYVLNGGNPNGPNAEKTDSATIVASQSSDLSADVKATSGAIGYVAAFYAQQNALNIISIDGISDANANVENNSYKFWLIEHMYTKDMATGLAKAFIDYMSGDSSDVQSIRQANDFLALSDFASSAIAAKQVTF